jgi:hypothetical protein
MNKKLIVTIIYIIFSIKLRFRWIIKLLNVTRVNSLLDILLLFRSRKPIFNSNFVFFFFHFHRHFEKVSIIMENLFKKFVSVIFVVVIHFIIIKGPVICLSLSQLIQYIRFKFWQLLDLLFFSF